MTYNITKDNTLVLKGIAIIAMLLHHLFYTPSEYEYIRNILTHLIGQLGGVCVAMFLFLSGYGLTVKYNKTLTNVNNSNWGGANINFIYSRFIKFYTNYWVVFLIFVPIGIFCFGRTLNIPYGEDANVYIMLFKDILGLNSYHSYNITWWFNALIIKLYIFFPLIYLYLSAHDKILAAMIFLVAYYIGKPFPFVLGIFIAMNIGTIENSLIRLNPTIIMLTSIAIVLLLTVCRQLSPVPGTHGARVDGFISLFLALSIVTFTQIFRYTFPVLRYLGKHSMNMYLIHTFIFYYFFPRFIYSFKYPFLIFLALLVTSLLISIAIERLKQITHYNNLTTKLLNIKL